MKNPLTSKEIRGLLAVAAAALLCIGSGFILRCIGSHGPGKPVPLEVLDDDSVALRKRGDAYGGYSTHSETRREGRKTDSVKGKKLQRERGRKADKMYPTRNPLDEPCD